MKKLLLLALVLLSVAAVLSHLRYLSNLSDLSQKKAESPVSKKPILRVALVADSHNENDLLLKALRQAQGRGINFVIGLGDYTNLGTVEELNAAKQVFDQSQLQYFVIPGDRDGWNSRQEGIENSSNFLSVFYPDCHSRPYRVNGSGNLENWIPHPFGSFINRQVGDDKNCTTQVFTEKEIQFILVDNSNIYNGISDEGWSQLANSLQQTANSSEQKALSGKLTFVFAHKTPFHPESKHIMGENSKTVADQAEEFLRLLEEKQIDGFFSGDLHFFAQFSTKGGSTSGGKSPAAYVKITTVGAVASERNFQGPRFAILTVYKDYSWKVEDIEIR